MADDKIKLIKCKGEIVDEKLAELELDTNGSLKMRVGRLAKHYADLEGEVDLANCSICGADSAADLPSCPFCGDEGAAVEEGEVAAEPAGEADDDIEEEVEEDGDIEGTGETIEGEEPEVEQGSEEPVAASKKATKAIKGKVTKAPKAVKPAKSGKGSKVAAPEVVEATGITVVDSSALDEQVQVIRDAVHGGAVALHRLGSAANKIVEENLWKQRVNDDGVPAFRSFKQFCVAEIGMTSVHVYRAMKVAEQFTEAQISQLSGKQVRLVLEVPKEARQEVIEAAKRGEAGSTLTQRANELRGGRKPLPDPNRGITVAVTAGHTKLKMFKRPATGTTKVGETEGATPAKRLADAPWAVMDLSNKVRMLIRVSTKPSGEIVCDVEFRRGETL